MTVGGQPMELDIRNRFSASIALPEQADERILHGENRSDTRTRSPNTAWSHHASETRTASRSKTDTLRYRSSPHMTGNLSLRRICTTLSVHCLARPGTGSLRSASQSQQYRIVRARLGYGEDPHWVPASGRYRCPVDHSLCL